MLRRGLDWLPTDRGGEPQRNLRQGAAAHHMKLGDPTIITTFALVESGLPSD